MNTDLVDRLLAECALLRPVPDPQLDAVRRAMLIEDVLGITLGDDDITLGLLTDADALRALRSPSPPG